MTRIWERFRPPRKRQPPPERTLILVIAADDQSYLRWCNSLGFDPRAEHLVHVKRLSDIRGGILDRTTWVVGAGRYWHCKDFKEISGLILRYLVHHPDKHSFRIG